MGSLLSVQNSHLYNCVEIKNWLIKLGDSFQCNTSISFLPILSKIFIGLFEMDKVLFAARDNWW